MDIHNLTTLQTLNDTTIISSLKKRYSSHKIYTYSGHTLISINPYDNIKIYGQNVINAYSDSNSTIYYPTKEPHIYAIAENALQHYQNCTLIISGESGSGKTVNNNYLLEYILAKTNAKEVSNLNNNVNFKINDYLLNISCVLEAFGNASTVLNDNSSRFGKKLEIRISEKRIVGARIETYLLEKSRVTHFGFNNGDVDSGKERNFHILYYLANHYKIDTKSEFLKNNNLEINDYDKVLECLKKLEIDNIDEIEKILIAVIYLGSIKFDENNKLIENNESKELCKCLDVNYEDMNIFLTKTVIKLPHETVVKENDLETILKTRNSLARNLYSNLFNYLVEKFNEKLDIGKCENYKIITLLDIYGFEVFKNNSFDQFCINWANEKIQNDFIKRMFIDLQNMYKEEGIDFDEIKYENNDIIDIFERSCGIVDLINEESLLPNKNVNNLLTKIENYCKIKIQNNKFIINHYAGNVDYIIDEFVSKNNELEIDLSKTFVNSNNKLLFEFSHRADNLKRPTILKYFRKSLESLFNEISSTKIFYVRCIKPNKNKINNFDDEYVLRQLKACGILETIEISKKTWAHYIFKDEFYERYSMLKNKYEIKEGINRVFMSNEILNLMEKERNEVINENKTCILKNVLYYYNKVKKEENSEIIRKSILKYHDNIKNEEEKKKLIEKLREEKEVENNIVDMYKENDIDEDSKITEIIENYEDNEFVKREDDIFLSNFCGETDTNQNNFCVINDNLAFDSKEMQPIGVCKFKSEEKGEVKKKMEEENIFKVNDYKEVIKTLEEKVKNYEKFCMMPCKNCKTMEMKYKFQTEELKKKRLKELEIENYKAKIEKLEEEIMNLKANHTNEENIIDIPAGKPFEDLNNVKPRFIYEKEDHVISFTSPYDIFGCLLELFLDFCPTTTSNYLPKDECLSLAHILYHTMIKLSNKGNRKLNELCDICTHEIRERFSIFEKSLQKVCFVLSNLIELKKILMNHDEIELMDLNDIISILGAHLCELLKNTIIDYLPDSIISHQGIKEFYCKESSLKSIFRKKTTIKQLVDSLEYSITVMQHFHIPENVSEQCLNHLLKTINSRSFNGILVKNNYLSYNRGVQINNNINEIERFLRYVGYPEGIHNLEHIRCMIKLINYIRSGSCIENILEDCNYLNKVQIMELISKFKKEEKENMQTAVREFVTNEAMEKFLGESEPVMVLEFDKIEHKFVVPRYVPSSYIQAILKSL